MASIWEKLKNCDEFEWDEGNSYKNWQKHKVTKRDAEQVFFNIPLIIAFDEKHSEVENRFLALGRTHGKKLLTLIFTIRKGSKVRIISARSMSKKERWAYEKKAEKDT